MYDVPTGEQRELPGFAIYPCKPAWSPDRKTLAFLEVAQSNTRTDTLTLAYYDLENGHTVQVLSLLHAFASSSVMPQDLQWTANGEGIRLAWSDDTPLWHVGTISLAGGVMSIETEFEMGDETWHARLAPDGAHLAYVTVPRDAADAETVCVRHLPTMEVRLIGEAGDNCEPLWSPSGKYLAYTGYSEDSEGIYLSDMPESRMRTYIPLYVGDDFSEMHPYPPCWVTDDTLVYASYEGGVDNVTRIHLFNARTQQDELLVELIGGVLGQLVGVS